MKATQTSLQHTHTLTTRPLGAVRLLPGLALAALLAVLATLAAQTASMQQLGLGSLMLAVLFGVVAGNTLYPHIAPWCSGGILFAKQPLLKLGIILYGFRLTFTEVLNLGVEAILINLCIVVTVFCAGYGLGRRWLGLDAQTAALIGAGNAICGASAIVATECVVRGGEQRVGVALAGVVIFGSIAMFAYPLLFQLLQQQEVFALTPHAFGIFTGSTVHEVAQVVAAGNALGAEAANAAVLSKMIRVLLLVPFLCLLSWWWQRRPASNAVAQPTGLIIPWFAVLFLLTCTLNSSGVVSAELTALLVQADNWLLCMAMAGLGVTIRIAALKQAGAAPLALAGLLFIVLVGIGGLYNLLLLTGGVL